jgi:hypothetical protein
VLSEDEMTILSLGEIGMTILSLGKIGKFSYISF